MKKLTSLAVFGLALSAAAAPTKLAEVTIADQTTLVKQATKFGELTGVPFIGMGAVGALSSNPMAEMFGAMRPNERTVVTVVGDPDLYQNTDETFEKFGDSIKFTILYPGSKTKADFLRENDDAVETNGVIRVDDDEFAAFSADGKWMSYGNCEKGVTAVLAEAGKAQLPGGEAVRVSLTEPALEIFAKLVDASQKESAASNDFDLDIDQMAQFYEAVKSMKTLAFSVKVSPAGLDVATEYVVKPGSAYSDYGTATLDSADPLAFAGTALFATAHAANCYKIDCHAAYKAITGVLNKYGVKTDFATIDREGAVSRLTLDLNAAIEYFKGEGVAAFEALDDNKEFQKEMLAAVSAVFKPSKAAESVSVDIKGSPMDSTASARFAAAFPEFKGRRFCEAYVASVYGAMFKVGGQLAPLAGDEEPMIRNLLQTLPPAGNGCIAGAAWREGDTVSGISRVTPEELKGLATTFMTVGVSSAMSAPMSVGGAYECEELEDDDDE